MKPVAFMTGEKLYWMTEENTPYYNILIISSPPLPHYQITPQICIINDTNSANK
jgi:hypothetical protein